MRVATATILLLTLALAGCSDGGSKAPADDPQEPGSVTQPTGLEPLSGWVFDPAIAPVEGAKVSIPGLRLETGTDSQGRYGFAGLPYGEVLVVVVEAAGHESSSKSVTLREGTALRLNFTLAPVPIQRAYSEALSFNGIIGCDGVVKAGGDEYDVNCGTSAAVDQHVWEFPVKKDVAGIIVEVGWNAGTPAAEHLNLTVETVGFGEFDEVLAHAEGPSVLRGQVNAFQSKRFYSDGGILRVTVDAGRDVDADETGTGAGLAAQQDFEAFATVFYVEGPPTTYSIFNP